jgi:4-hydroxy-tetrahydrodipicolinate synthase
MELKGTVTALVTPFRDGRIDFESLKKLVDFQCSAGVRGLLACGCTGEPATLSDREKTAVIETVLEASGGSTQVIAGTGTNSTETTVEFTRRVSRMPVDAVLVITPYYNKPTAEGQIAHYTAAAEASEKPLVIYNVPGRTGTCMTVETLAKLGEHPNIVGVKDAAGNVERVTELGRISGMVYMSGDDHIALPQILMGASGVVSVTSNAAPGKMAKMVELGLEGEAVKARQLHREIYPLFRALFVETNPSPVKEALRLLGVIADGSPRLPLVPVRKETTELLRNILHELGQV